MAHVYVKHNPYQLKTAIVIDGVEIPGDSTLYKLTNGVSLQIWAEKFPEELIKECKSSDLFLEYYGMESDYQDIKNAFVLAKRERKIDSYNIRHVCSIKNDNSIDNIHKVANATFNKLNNDSIGTLLSQSLEFKSALDRFNKALFSVNVIAIMSAGKSTLVNSFIGRSILPTSNTACTAAIAEIHDTNDDSYSSVDSYNFNGKHVSKYSEISDDLIEKLNSDKEIERIVLRCNIPFIKVNSANLMIVDTPGSNNSQDISHKGITDKIMDNSLHTLANGVVLCLLNGGELLSTGDGEVIERVVESIKKYVCNNKLKMCDKIIFVVNKSDAFDPDKQVVQEEVEKIKKSLIKRGIEFPKVFLCSSLVSWGLRTELKQFKDILEPSRNEKKNISKFGKDALGIAERLYDNEQMHLEQYASLPLSVKEEIDKRLNKAIENDNVKEQMLIHSGVPSLEAAIEFYMVRDIKMRRVSDVVEAFKVVVNTDKLSELKEKIVINKINICSPLSNKASNIQESIDSESKIDDIKEQIDKVDSVGLINTVNSKIKQSIASSKRDVYVYIHNNYAIVRLNATDENIKQLFKKLNKFASNIVHLIISELKELIRQEIVKPYKSLFAKYKKKLLKFDSKLFADIDLDFSLPSYLNNTFDSLCESIDLLYSASASTFCKRFKLGFVPLYDQIIRLKESQNNELVLCDEKQLASEFIKVLKGGLISVFDAINQYVANIKEQFSSYHVTFKYEVATKQFELAQCNLEINSRKAEYEAALRDINKQVMDVNNITDIDVPILEKV